MEWPTGRRRRQPTTAPQPPEPEDAPPSLSHHLPLSPSQLQQPPSSLVKLQLIMQATLLSIDQLATLLTSVSLTLTSAHTEDVLPTFLHCLARIGRHCPLVEHIALRLHYLRQLPGQEVILLGLREVQRVVNAYKLPEQAFTRLRRVRQVVFGLEVLSSEAAEYVRRHWLSGVRGAVSLDWQGQYFHL